MILLIVACAWLLTSIPVAVFLGRALSRNSATLEPARNAPAGRWAA